MKPTEQPSKYNIVSQGDELFCIKRIDDSEMASRFNNDDINKNLSQRDATQKLFFLQDCEYIIRSGIEMFEDGLKDHAENLPDDRQG